MLQHQLRAWTRALPGLTLVIALTCVACCASPAESRVLVPVGRIGAGWGDHASGWMRFVAFNAAGTRVASDGPADPEDTSGDLTLWSFPAGRLIRHVKHRPDALSDDWKYIANAQGIRDLNGGEDLIAAGAGAGAIVAFSHDDRYAVEAPIAPGAPAIRIVALPRGGEIRAFGTHHPFSLAISPDNAVLAAGHWNMVALWDVARGRRLAVLYGAARYVEGLSFSRDGRWLAAGGDFGVLEVWDLRRRRKVWSIDLGGLDVSAPAFSPDGKYVAAGVYGTGSVFLVSVASGKRVDHRRVSGIGCGAVAFSPDGRFLIAPSSGGLVTWPPDRGGIIRVFRVKR